MPVAQGQYHRLEESPPSVGEGGTPDPPLPSSAQLGRLDLSPASDRPGEGSPHSQTSSTNHLEKARFPDKEHYQGLVKLPGSQVTKNIVSTLPKRFGFQYAVDQKARAAAKDGNLDVLENAFLMGEPDINARSAGGHTLLDHAKAIRDDNKRIKIVEYLEKRGALTSKQLDLNADLRATRVRKEMGRLLFLGADPCCSVEGPSVLSTLIAEGPDRLPLIEFVTEYRRTNIADITAAVKLLKSQNRHEQYSATVARLDNLSAAAIRVRQLDDIKVARSALPEQQQKAFGHEFRALCRSGELEKAKKLYKLGLVGMADKSRNGRIALDGTTDLDVINWMLDEVKPEERQELVNSTDTKGRTPLISFTRSSLSARPIGTIEAVELLLDNGADAKKKDNYGNSAPFYAVQNQGFYADAGKLVQLLLDKVEGEPVDGDSIWSQKANNKTLLQTFEYTGMNEVKFDVLARLYQARARATKDFVCVRPDRLSRSGLFPSERRRILHENGGQLIHVNAYANRVDPFKERVKELRESAKMRGQNPEEVKKILKNSIEKEFRKPKDHNGKDALDYAMEGDSVRTFNWLMKNVFTEMGKDEWERRMQAATKLKDSDGELWVTNVFCYMNYMHGIDDRYVNWKGLVAPPESGRPNGRSPT
jgi:ankyrin repeat protein